MLTASKNTAGLMVDLAYGAVYFDDPEMAGEVDRLWDDLTELAHQMRVVAVLAARTRREAEDMAAVVRIIGAMEDLGRDAVDIAHITSQGAGVPADLVMAIADSETVMSRVVVSAGSLLAGARLASVRLPLETGSRVIAVRSGDTWETDLEGSTVLEADDVMVLTGPQDGLPLVRELAGAQSTATADRSDATEVHGLGPAVEVLIEMKTLSEVAVGLAYAALLTGDRGVADEVNALAAQLDQLKTDLQAWVLQTALEVGDASGLTSLLQLSQAAEDLGDRAAEMVSTVTDHDGVHPVMILALGESEEVAERMTIAPGSAAAGATLRRVTAGTGFDVLALRRDGRYQHRPTNDVAIRAGDVLIATGPQEGRSLLAARCKRPLDEDP